MTPKEKAQELNSYFYELVADTPDPEWRAKQAALIAVDEIILSRKDDSQFDDTLWSGGRTLKRTKEDCQLKFDKILEEGEYTAKDLIDSLNLDVLQKKENSVKTGAKQLLL